MTGADWESRFEGMGEEYFPGSSQKIPRQPTEFSKPAEPESPSWDAKPRFVMFNGVEYEVFYIRHLASAMGRKTVTIRLWEDQGFIPETIRATTKHPKKGHRIYSRAQIEGLIRIAKEEGVYGSAHAQLIRTSFKEKAASLFASLAKEPLNGATPKGDQR